VNKGEHELFGNELEGIYTYVQSLELREHEALLELQEKNY